MMAKERPAHQAEDSKPMDLHEHFVEQVERLNQKLLELEEIRLRLH